MSDLKIVLVDIDKSFIKLFIDKYQGTFIFNSWNELVDCKPATYDLIIINFDIIKRSKLCLVDEMFINNIDKQILVLIDQKYERTLSSHNELGYIFKNDDICKIEMQVMKQINSDYKIISLLHDLGIGSNMKGFKYILEAVKIMREVDIKYITKDLYPRLAIKFNTNVYNIERSIRHAIETGFTRGNLNKIEKYFGNSINLNKDHPSNFTYILTILEILKLNR